MSKSGDKEQKDKKQNVHISGCFLYICFVSCTDSLFAGCTVYLYNYRLHQKATVTMLMLGAMIKIGR